MKRRLFLVFVLNVVAAICFCLYSGRKVFADNAPTFQSFQDVQKIAMFFNDEELFHAEKSDKIGTWMIFSQKYKWMANSNTLEDVYYRLVDNYDSAIDREGPYKIVVDNGNTQRTFTLNERDLAEIFHYEEQYYIKRNKNTGNVIDTNSINDAVLQDVTSRSITINSFNNYKIIKIKLGNSEFVLSKHGQDWCFDIPFSNIQADVTNISKLFTAIRKAHADEIRTSYEKIERPTFAIQLLGDTNVETLTFFSSDHSNTCKISNDTSQVSFTANYNTINSISEKINDLLSIKIFDVQPCNSINFDLLDNDEQFSLNNSNSQWQFTHLENGKLNVKNADKRHAEDLTNFLKNTESITILDDLKENKETFEKFLSIKITKDSTKTTIVNIYRYGDRVFAEINDQQTKFEINSSFIPVLFHILRSNFSDGSSLL